MAIVGCTCGPIGTILCKIFPTQVRYTGSALACTLAAILGASVAPLISMSLAQKIGLCAIGYYLFVAASIAFIFIKDTKNVELNNPETYF